MDPEYAGSYDNRAILKALLEDYEGALRDHNKAIELSPDDKLCYENRAEIFEKLAAIAKTDKEKKEYLEKAKADKETARKNDLK